MKILKIVLFVVGFTVVIYFVLNFLDIKTLYSGYVSIDPVSLSDIKLKLNSESCNNYNSFCPYEEVEVPGLKKNGLKIYPQGPGWGLIYFYLTEDKLWLDTDIQGFKDTEKFKKAVRYNVESINNVIGNIIKVKEDSLVIVQTNTRPTHGIVQ